MKRLLIIGASILQLPAIKKAKEMGHYVAVADFNPNAVGIPYADEFYNASTIDIEAICKVAEEFKPDGIMTLATDMPMRSIAAATSRLGLPGISMDTAIKSTDKGEMIKAFKAHDVESPWFYIIDNVTVLNALLPHLTYPCILKPTDNAGSRGVMLVNSADQLIEAYQYSVSQSRGGLVILEEYMTGPEVSVEVMVVDGEPHVLQVTDKLTTGAPYFVEMGHNQPSMLPTEDVEKIKDLACRAVKSVGINCGPSHVEIKLTPTGPKMVELGARMGGDCITTHLVPLSTGVDMIKATIDVSLGLTPDITPTLQKGSAIRFFDAPCGIVSAIEGVEEAKAVEGVQEIAFTKNVGDEVTEIHSSLDRCGFVIAQCDSATEAIGVCEKAKNLIRLTV
ncbi:MAG: ATP-grasp domain-containing protein [Bacteroidaceae bacterium]|nr:ATP-grasp domain-containing protein [Bacteroidaceae bacterium]